MYRKTIVSGLALALAGAGFGQDGGGAPAHLRDTKLAAEAATVRVFGGQFSFDEKTVKGAPYSAEAVTETTQTLADGNHISRTESAIVARDSEGRTRREQVISKIGPWATADSGQQKIVFINDPVAQVNYVLEPDHTARKMLAPPAPDNMVFMKKVKDEAASAAPVIALQTLAVSAGPAMNTFALTARNSGSGPAPKTEQLGTQVMEGVQAEGTRVTTTIPAGQIGNEREINITWERWYSPELQTVVMTKSNDPRSGQTTFRLTNIQRSEPPISMFEVPSDYKTEDGPVIRQDIKIKD